MKGLVATLLIACTGEPAVPPSEPVQGLPLAERVKAEVLLREPGAAVVIVDERELIIVRAATQDRQSMGLDNLTRRCTVEPEQCADHIAQHLDVLLADKDTTEAGAEALRPVVVSDFWLAALADAGAGSAITSPLAGDLHVGHVLDYPLYVTPLLSNQLDEIGLTADEARARSMKNFADTAIGTPEAVAPGLWTLPVNDEYVASRLLLHDQWKPIAAGMKGDLVAAVPMRTGLLWADSADAKAMNDLAVVSVGAFGNEPHPISPTLLKWTESGWEVHTHASQMLAP